MISAADITWTFRSHGRPEQTHSLEALVCDLSTDELRTYCLILQAELDTVRLICHEAVAQLAAVSAERDQLRHLLDLNGPR